MVTTDLEYTQEEIAQAIAVVRRVLAVARDSRGLTTEQRTQLRAAHTALAGLPKQSRRGETDFEDVAAKVKLGEANLKASRSAE